MATAVSSFEIQHAGWVDQSRQSWAKFMADQG